MLIRSEGRLGRAGNWTQCKPFIVSLSCTLSGALALLRSGVVRDLGNWISATVPHFTGPLNPD
jgi:hypothetical protein